MSEELKMAVKCKEPKQRTTLKRKCSTCVVSGDHLKHGYNHTGSGNIVAGPVNIVSSGHAETTRSGHCQYQQQHRAEVYHHHLPLATNQSTNHIGASSSSYYHNNTYVPQVGLDEPVNELYDQRTRAVSARHTPTRDYRNVTPPPPPSDNEHYTTGASGRHEGTRLGQGLFNNLIRKRNGCNSARCKINTGGGNQNQWSGKPIGLRHQQTPSATFYFAPSCQYEDQETDLHHPEDMYQQRKQLSDDCDSDNEVQPPMQLSTSQLVINQSNLIMSKDMLPAPPPPPSSMPPSDMCGNGATTNRPLSSLGGGYNRSVVDVECYRDRCATFAAPGTNTPGNITPSGMNRQYIEHVGSGNLNDNIDTIS